MLLFIYLLAFIWGGIWAAFLQWHPFGQFIVIKRTWLTVVIGIGVDLLIALIVIPWLYWQRFALIIVLSSLLILVRSVINEWSEWRELLNEFRDGSQQDCEEAVGE